MKFSVNYFEKSQEVRKLSLKRRSEKFKNYQNVGDFFYGRYETSDFVSRFTKSACNFDSSVFIVAQDWASGDALLNSKYSSELAELGYIPNLPTNKNLHQLLKNHLNLEFKDVYATNAFVFIKPGRMSSRIPSSDLSYSLSNYTIPEILIIKPKLVICLGSYVFKTLSKVIGQARKGLPDSLENPLELNGIKIIGAYHTGGLGTAAAGGHEKVDEYWAKLSKNYDSLVS